MRKEDPLRASRKHRRQRGSVMIMFTLMLPVVIMLVGLGIDRTMVFLVEARLSSAVDGAALGAGRLLGTSANTSEIAGEFLNANFPSGYWGTTNLTPYITYTTNIALHTITVGATVTVPLLFLSVFNQKTATVGATATATRRDSRIVMVLDRSGSMAGAPLTSLISGATSLTNAFTPPGDELGLVVFGSTAIVAYPPAPRPYTSATNAGGGPDSSFKASGVTGGNLLDQLNALQSGGATNMSEGLALAYVELQKSYNRDVAANGSDNRLNSIVLFTDGMPTAFSVYLNSPNSPPGNVINGGSNNCTNKTATATATTQMIGGILNTGNGATTDSTWGPYALATAYNDSTSTLTWMARTNDYTYKINPTTPTSGCNNLNNAEDGTDLKDLTKIPPYDLYGTSTVNQTNATDYQYSWLYNQYSTTYNPTGSTSAQNGYQLAIAGWNLVDNTGLKIRSQTAINSIYIYTIGYQGNGGTDNALLQRLANQSDSSSYNSAQPIGQYVQAWTTADLVAAFNTVAGAILRLAK